MRPRHMSLCSGYDGIGLALEASINAETVAVADIDPGACRVLAYRYPHVPNLGDISAVDWSQWVGRVDIISGGTPCQDLSHAGRRAGMTEGTRSNLWVQMREAIAVIRPALVVWENVRGAYSAEADSALESCPRCVGDPRDSGPVLRALGRVLGDLSSLGYDSIRYGLRASDVGAAHHRYRVFVYAWPADATGDTWRLLHGDVRAAADGQGDEQREPLVTGPLRHESRSGAGSDAASLTLLPTPVNNDMGEGKTVESLAIEAQRLLPTPRAQARDRIYAREDHHNNLEEILGYIIEGRSALREGNRQADLNDLPRLLPTPRAENPGSTSDTHGLRLNDAVGLTGRAERQGIRWGDYAPAIARWETIIGREAPAPTEPGRDSKPRLSAAFVEWLMGLPDGWITDPAMWADVKPSTARKQQLKLAGNGVVPQQCYAALERLKSDFARYVMGVAA